MREDQTKPQPRAWSLTDIWINSFRSHFLGLLDSVWVEVQSSTVKEDRGTEVVAVAKASGGLLDPLDLGVDAFRDGVGDVVLQIGEDVVEPGLEHPRHLLDGLERRPDRPAVPSIKELPRRAQVYVAPEVRARMVNGPGAGRLQGAVS